VTVAKKVKKRKLKTGESTKPLVLYAFIHNSCHPILFYFFQINDKGRLVPLTCHEYSRVKHINITQ